MTDSLHPKAMFRCSSFVNLRASGALRKDSFLNHFIIAANPLLLASLRSVTEPVSDKEISTVVSTDWQHFLAAPFHMSDSACSP
jgi:hypothetical protein